MELFLTEIDISMSSSTMMTNKTFMIYITIAFACKIIPSQQHANKGFDILNTFQIPLVNRQLSRGLHKNQRKKVTTNNYLSMQDVLKMGNGYHNDMQSNTECHCMKCSNRLLHFSVLENCVIS